MATLLQNLDLSQITFGDYKDGDKIGTVKMSMPVLHIDTLLSSKYGVNPNFEVNGRYPLEVDITPEIDEQIAKLEAHIKKTFAANSRSWFKKDKQFVFSSMVRDMEEGGAVLKVKITKDTFMRRLSEDGTILKNTEATIAHLNRFCKVTLFLHSYSLWVNTEELTYGLSLKAKALLIKSGVDEDHIESMILSAGYSYE